MQIFGQTIGYLLRKIILTISVIAFFLTALIIIAIFSVDDEGLYEEFINKTSITKEAAPKEAFTFKKSPWPHLVIEEINYNDRIILKDIRISLEIMSLMQFKPKVGSVDIGEATVYLSNDEVNFLNHNNFFSELINNGFLSIQSNIGKITFIEADDDIPFIVENFVFTGENEMASFTGNIRPFGKLTGSFTQKEEQIDFSLDLQAPEYDLKLSENYNNNLMTSGLGVITFSHLPKKLARLFPDLGQVIRKFKSEEQIKVSFDMIPIHDWIKLDNIIIQSNSLEGKGQLSFSKNSNKIDEIKLHFSKIDLNSWMLPPDNKTTATTQAEDTPLTTFSNDIRFNFDNNRMDFEVIADSIKIDENNILTDVQLKANIGDGSLRLESLTGNVNQSGSFTLSGIANQNNFRSIFNGKFSLSHNDLNDVAELIGDKELRTAEKIPFTITSDVKVSSVDISLPNLLLQTTDGNVISGNVSSKFIGQVPRVNAKLKISNIDLHKNNLPAAKIIYDYIVSLTENMKDQEYLNKFIPIRKINSLSKYNIAVDRLNTQNNTYKNFKINVATAPGKLDLNNLYLDDGNDYIDASVNWLAKGIKPEVNIKIHDGSMKVSFLSSDSIISLRKKILDNFDLEKIGLNLDISLSKIYQQDFVLSDIILKAKTDKNLFNVSQFDAGIFSGKFISSGSILLDPYTFNFVYSLNSAHIDEIAKVLPQGLLRSNGFASANGFFSTNGDKLEELLYNLYVKSSIIAKDVTLSNFSVDDLITIISKKNYDIKNLNKDIKKSLLTGNTEFSELTTDLELSKGIIKTPVINFKTKHSSGTASSILNLYNFDINLSSIFSFYIAQQQYNRGFVDFKPTTLTVNASGSIFSPNKEADTENLKESILERNKRKLRPRYNQNR